MKRIVRGFSRVGERRLWVGVLGAVMICGIAGTQVALASGNAPTTSVQASVGVFSASVSSIVSRVPRQISSISCRLTAPGGATTSVGCGSQTSNSTSTTWRASLSGLNAGAYTFAATIVLTDGGQATASASFTVKPVKPTCTVTGYSVTYDTNAHLATGSCTGVGGVALPTGDLALGGTSHTNGGTYTDPWSFTDPAGNYTPLSGTVADAIGVAGQSITFGAGPVSPTTGGSYSPSAAASSGLPVTFTIDSSSGSNCALANGVVSFAGAGSCTVDADQSGNGNWAQAPTAQQTFTITSPAKQSQTVSFTSTAPAATTPYSLPPGTTAAYLAGPVYTPTAEATSGLTTDITVDPSSSSVCEFSGDKLNFIGVGTCTIDANQVGDDSWAAAPQVQQSFSVGGIVQVVTATDADGSLQSVRLPPGDMTGCDPETPAAGGCFIDPLDGTVLNQLDSTGTLDPSVDPNLYTTSYHWQIYKPPGLGSALYSSNGITGYHAPVLNILDSSLPELIGTGAGPYVYWSVGFTVTINGYTTTGYFKFQYTSSTLTLRLSTTCQVAGQASSLQCQLSAGHGLSATEPT